MIFSDGSYVVPDYKANKMNIFEPIAVIGISCEFAGDIHSPVDFWQSLERKRDLSNDTLKDWLNQKSVCAVPVLKQETDGTSDETPTHRGYFLSNDLWNMFEPSFFAISDAEAATIDPCHRLLMLKFVHLLDDAGYSMDSIRGSQTSVHIAQYSTDDPEAFVGLKSKHQSSFRNQNTWLYNASSRLSCHFDLHGPSLSMDAACSGSLHALHLAVQTLRMSEANMAVCGGVNLIYVPATLTDQSISDAPSSNVKYGAFSIDTDGYAKGEGLGLVLLKRLSDAERDGDKIYCVVRDVLCNHDGCEGKSSYVGSSGAGHERLLTDTYKRTHYDTSRIFYIETHGKGTQVEDSVEFNTFGRFFDRSSLDPPLLIGSVRNNIGHTGGAAGVAALIKVAVCMHHRAIPPNMHIAALNPTIDQRRYNLHVPQSMVPFPSSDADEQRSPVGIAINSFVAGGNNAHALIEEYYRSNKSLISDNMVENKQHLPQQQHFLFIFSTKSPESLHKQVVSFNAWLHHEAKMIEEELSFLMRVSQQLLLKRTISHDYLAIFISPDREQLQQQIDSFLAEQLPPPGLFIKRPLSCYGDRRVCFVYTGLGPQWWAMGRQLYESESIFRQWIDRIDTELIEVNNGEWYLLEELIDTDSEQESRINDINIAQVALFAIQVGLTALFVSWHVFPSAIVSHSSGEHAAAYVAGRVSLKEAVRIVYHRSRLQQQNTGQGGRMLAVAMSEQEAHDLLLRDISHLVCVGAVNSPRSITLSGDEETIYELEERLTTFHPTVFKARLPVENASHSYQMERFGIREELLLRLDDIRGLPLEDPQEIFDEQCARVPLYSSVIGGKVDHASTPLNAWHWWLNLRHCVRFGDAIQTIIRDNNADTFLELSPRPILTTPIRQCCENKDFQSLVLSTLKKNEDEQRTVLTSLAQLTHSPVVWHHYFVSRSIQTSNREEHLFDTFPLYTFNTSPCWYTLKESILDRHVCRLSSHPLLGIRQWTREQTSAVWKSIIDLQLPTHQFLHDYKIQGTMMFPTAAFLELAIAACYQLYSLEATEEQFIPIAFKEVKFCKVLHLNENNPTEIYTRVVGMPIQEWFIYSRPSASSGLDCLQSEGIVAPNILDSFVNQRILNQNSMSEFTLHAHGRIDIGRHFNLSASSAVRLNFSDTQLCDQDVSHVYALLSTRGYEYGPNFRLTQSFKSSPLEAISHVLDNYDVNPCVLDSCFQCLQLILPGQETFLPFSIDKMIVLSDTVNVDHLTTYASRHPSVSSVSTHEHSFTFDLSILNGNEHTDTTPIFLFYNLTYDRISSSTSVNKTVVDNKLET